MINRQRWAQGRPLPEVLALALALATLMLVLVLFPSRGAFALAPLKADYRFQNTLSSSVGAAPALTTIGPGTNTFTTATVDGASRRLLSFPEGNGLKLSPTTGVVSSDAYTIVVLFEFDSVSGYRRIVDFKNGTSDNGLYVHDGKLEFFPHASGAAAPLAANRYVQVVLTRNASSKEVVGYVDGVQQFSFTDSSNDAVIDANDNLRFFKDNASGGASTEHSAGSVGRVRLYNGALTPSEVGALDRLEPTTFTVNSTEDEADNNVSDGKCFTGTVLSGTELCTLRAAIQQANATQGADQINFGIVPATSIRCDQTTKVCTISPSSELPDITEAVTIDGYTQEGARPNTLANGTNAALKVELSGASAGTSGVGLTINASNSTVRGLVINSWSPRGVQISGSGATGNKIQGNFIGTDPAGAQDLGNGYGVVIESANNTVGGTALSARNLISGNDYGMVISGSGNTVQGNLIGTDKTGTKDLGNGFGVNATSSNNVIGGTVPAARNLISGNGYGVTISDPGNRVQGNFIGTKADGVGALGNSEHGVSISDPNNTIGGAVSARNVIAFNGGDGVSVFTSDDIRNRILSNSIYNNGELGIDLFGNDGVTANDNGPPPDADAGANNLQNFPVISEARTSEGSTTVRGSLKSTPKRTFTLQFFSSPFRDASGFGEGKTFLDQKTVTTDVNGNVSFTFTLARTAPGGQSVTATATDPGGNTSEYSKARQVSEVV